MSKRGSKPLTPAEKLARGTTRPDRATFETMASPSPAMGMAPPELPYAVALVWEEYVAAAVAHGALQCDADAFAEWCTMTSNLRRSRGAAGTDADGVPPSSYIQQWRTLGELFGLAGPKSRVHTKPAGGVPNPFLRARAGGGQ